MQLYSDAVYSAAALGSIHQRAKMLQVQCQDCLKKAELALQSVSPHLHRKTTGFLKKGEMQTESII